MKKAAITLLLLLILAYTHRCVGLSCRGCRKACPPITCSYGTQLDPCRCCPVCTPGPGERCDGPFRVAGTCARGLTCVKHLDPALPYFLAQQEFGVCQSLLTRIRREEGTAKPSVKE